VSTLDQLARFVASFCETRTQAAGARCKRAVENILTSPAFPTVLDRQAALYGFAQGIGADAAPGFNPSWYWRSASGTGSAERPHGEARPDD
jgi:uncharacterized protein YbjT (DUF2867 family)